MDTSTTNLPALAESCIQTVQEQVLNLQKNKELDLPSDYSAANALRSAYLILQDTVDMNKKPALEVCTQASIAHALLSMVTQGLNPAKEQGYFIVYGKKLVFQRSYFGYEALAKRVDPCIKDIAAEAVYAGDTLEYAIVSGKKQVTSHLQTLDSVEGSKIKAAYAMTIDHQGEITKTIIMTIDEIKASWAQSKMKSVTDDGKVRKGSTHDKFSGQMARKTVINRLCKEIINSSSDSSLFKKAIVDADQSIIESVITNAIDEKANHIPIDIDTETGEVVNVTPVAEKALEPPPGKSEPQKDTQAPAENKESPESHEEPELEETKNPIRTKPKFVANLLEYLNKIQPAMLEGALERLREESFGSLCKEDKDAVSEYCDKLIAQRDEAEEQSSLEF